MSMIEHEGVVQQVAGDRVVVALATAGCASCGQGGSCGVGRMAAGRPATLLTLKDAGGGWQPGQNVKVAIAESRLRGLALLGYLFPVLALLLGAGLGVLWQGSDAAAALGALAGFLLALCLARFALPLLPGWLPQPVLLPLPTTYSLSQQEFSHER
ncbi:MAG: hypothetical protein RIR00_916 [Pseudomonadota bacterium]